MIYSKQRELIMDCLHVHPSHPSADELYALLRVDHPGISLATVYRNLNQLVECGQIMRISVPHCADRFDAVNDGHYHMTCESCGHIDDIPREAVPDVCKAATAATGLDIHGSKLIFYGVCNACKH
ncbi:MAG: transcriptional repressor [Clostridia bacterium]